LQYGGAGMDLDAITVDNVAGCPASDLAKDQGSRDDAI
jgi:hypothetical protein